MRRQISKHTYITDRPNKLLAMAMEDSMECEIHLDKTHCKHCMWERKNGCGYPEFRQRKQLADLIAMREVNVKK